jgi:hypothetical protein
LFPSLSTFLGPCLSAVPFSTETIDWPKWPQVNRPRYGKLYQQMAVILCERFFCFGTESIHLIFSPSSWKTFENLKMLIHFSTVWDFSVYYAKWHQFVNLGL